MTSQAERLLRLMAPEPTMLLKNKRQCLVRAPLEQRAANGMQMITTRGNIRKPLYTSWQERSRSSYVRPSQAIADRNVVDISRRKSL